MRNKYLKESLAKLAYLALIGSTGYLVSYPVLAGPSDAYKKQENSCWNNPDFVSTDESTSRFCINNNGVINKVCPSTTLHKFKSRPNCIRTVNKQTPSIISGKINGTSMNEIDIFFP